MRWDNRSIEEVNAEDVMKSCNPLESTGLGTAQEANKGESVQPMKYTHDFAMVIHYDSIVHLCILNCGDRVVYGWFPQWQWSNSEEYGCLAIKL